MSINHITVDYRADQDLAIESRRRPNGGVEISLDNLAVNLVLTDNQLVQLRDVIDAAATR